MRVVSAGDRAPRSPAILVHKRGLHPAFFAYDPGQRDHGQAQDPHRRRRGRHPALSRARLREKGYDVSAATGGAEAWLARAPSAPICAPDIGMPQMDGWEVLRQLRQDPRTAKIPVAMVSARYGHQGAIEDLHEGAVDYICKPFALDDLLAKDRLHLLQTGTSGDRALRPVPERLEEVKAQLVDRAAWPPPPRRVSRAALEYEYAASPTNEVSSACSRLHRAAGPRFTSARSGHPTSRAGALPHLPRRKRRQALPMTPADVRAARARVAAALLPNLARTAFPYFKTPLRIDLRQRAGPPEPLDRAGAHRPPRHPGRPGVRNHFRRVTSWPCANASRT